MATAGRLVLKHKDDTKLVFDPMGNLFVKGDRTTPSEGHAGLLFKASTKATPCVSIKISPDIAKDGMLVADFADSNVSSFAGQDSFTLVFKKNNEAKVAFQYAPQGGGVKVSKEFIAKFATRKNAAKVKQVERDNLRDAFLLLNKERFYPDGVSYWDKQDAIHQATHVHNGPSFLPWHRELCNRFEALLREVDSTVSLHYWDWTTDPRGGPGTANLFSTGPNGFMGSASDAAGVPLQDFAISRSLAPGAPNVPSDANLINTGQDLAEKSQFQSFRTTFEEVHGDVHAYIGGTIGVQHSAFEDPFVFLLHSNVDRLFALWQGASSRAWRLDPERVYGSEENTVDERGILTPMEPWAGNSNLRPWTPQDGQQFSKNSRDDTVVIPPIYDSDL